MKCYTLGIAEFGRMRSRRPLRVEMRHWPWKWLQRLRESETKSTEMDVVSTKGWLFSHDILLIKLVCC